MLNGHGDDLHLVAGKIRHNFSSNVYFKGCPDTLLEVIQGRINNIQNYPSPSAEELNVLAAKQWNLSADQFLFTNGATEAFYLLGHLFSKKSAAIVAPTFAEYADACRLFGVNYKLISRDELSEVNTDAVFLCNPNNPDGSVFSTNELKSLLQNKPQTTFVIDEAYIEFTNATYSMLPFVDEFNNLILVRSLTKTFAIPGLRLGYLVSNSAVIEQLIALKMPWSVNALAIEAGKCIFENYAHLRFNLDELLVETKVFQGRLAQLKGVTVHASNTSYFLIELESKTAKACKDYLIHEHEILVRDATNFEGLNGECIRIATQDQTANQRLIEALEAWL